MYMCLIFTIVHKTDDGDEDISIGSITSNLNVIAAAGGIILMVIVANLMIIILLCCCCRGRRSKGM